MFKKMKFLQKWTAITIAISLFFSTATLPARAQDAETLAPNIVYFQVDNLGFGELGTYGGGILRGTPTPRIDQFAEEGLKLLNFAPESQCTPSRSALMTGRYAIRSGTHTVEFGGTAGGLVAWEKTIADILSENGYNNYILGKWHIGETPGRLPTDHGFRYWYGVPRSYGEAYWFDDPYYAPKLNPGDPGYNPDTPDRGDPVARVVESCSDITLEAVEACSAENLNTLQESELLTIDVRRDLDVKYLDRAQQRIEESIDEGKPFFLYFNHTMMHYPLVPRDEFQGKTGYGDFADSLAQLDADFGTLLDFLAITDDPRNAGKKLADTTIVVFAGDNGADDTYGARGNSGFFEGSLFAGGEGNLRTAGIVRYPGVVLAGRESDEIVHITDMFPTLVRWAGAEIPQDRQIDGVDQRAFFEGNQTNSAREGFPFWNGPTLYGIKWQHYKMKYYDQTNVFDPALKLATPYLINLKVDPKERTPLQYPYTWVTAHIGQILANFQKSVEEEPLIPAGAPLEATPEDYLPESQN